MPELPPSQQPESWESAGEGVTTGIINRLLKLEWAKPVSTFVAEVAGRLATFAFTLITPIGVGMARGIANAEDKVIPELAEIAAAAASDVFGSDIPASTFAHKRNRGARSTASDALGVGLLNTIKGQGGPIVPSEAGAQRYLGMVVNMALEGWYQGFIFEYLSSIVPYIDIGKIESFGELDDTLAQSLGLGRMSRRVIGPILDATVVRPLQWQTNKTYRPELLTASVIANQIARGKWTREQAIEELARQGYSDERIDALLVNAAKGHSIADLDLLIRAGQWTRSAAITHLGEQGYAADAAGVELDIERLKEIASFERQMATAAVQAFADGRIEEAELGGFATGATITPQERAQFVELAHARRALGRRGLTPGEAEQAVKAKILSLSDYRAALRRDGRTEDAITALDLLLRWEMDKTAAIEALRRQQEEERAREKAARDEAARIRALELAAERALKRRGSEATLEAAAIRGLIPLTRVEEIYRARYDGETVGVYMELLAAQRQDYLDRAAAAELARQRGAVRGVDVGSLERAVTVGTLTIGEYRARLTQLGFSGADAGLLAETLQRHLENVADAQRDRDEAAAAAKIRQIDLGRLETLVRRGHRSLGEYSAVLASLGFDEASRAAMVELLQLHINDDADDRAEREAAEARLRVKGVSLELIRRGVLLGVRTIDDFQRFLVANGFTADAQVLLMASLRADVAEAEAARQRRIAAAEGVGSLRAPLSDVARAARLGLVTVATYTARLVELGYTDDDVALETDLLVEEIANVQAARRARAEAEAAANNRGLSLAQTAALVRAGRSTLALYRDAAIGVGYGKEAADALTSLLEDELAADVEAEARRAAVTAAAAVKHVSLGQLEAGVLAGLRSLDDYAAAVAALGYGADDAELLIGLLVTRLEKLPTAPAHVAELDAADTVRALARKRFASDVIAGVKKTDDYAAWLAANGYGPDDVSAAVDLVWVELVNAPGAQP